MRFCPCALLAVVTAAGLAACGDRTGLLVPDDQLGGSGSSESGSSVSGSSASGSPASGVSTSGLPEDDAGEIGDALPPLDVTVPEDAPTDCPDASSTLIYVMTDQSHLYSFYPPMGAFTMIGTISCPITIATANDGTAAAPFSMAVDRTGIAYVVYNTGELFRVSTATASCRRTPFKGDPSGFAVDFGMGFSRDNGGPGETLYVASGGTMPPQLGSIDTTTFALRIIGPLTPPAPSAELTGTGAGDLFGFYATTGAAACTGSRCSDTSIVQIDKSSGRVTNQTILRGLMIGDAWAFAFWGGDFYTFTHPPRGSSLATRFRPSDGSLVTVSKLREPIVGAGVSTCAPAR
jgi:hypothetical protein